MSQSCRHTEEIGLYMPALESIILYGCPFAENPTDTECDESGKLIMGALLDAADRHSKMGYAMWLGKILILKYELWGNHDEEKIY